MSAPVAAVFAALADPARLDIVRELAAERDVCACDFEVCRELAQPTVSHHLRVLREAGVVTAERRGSHVHYGLDRKALGALRAFLETLETIPAPTASGCCP